MKLQAEQSSGRDEDLSIQIPSGSPLGDLVIKAEGISKRFHDSINFQKTHLNAITGFSGAASRTPMPPTPVPALPRASAA